MPRPRAYHALAEDAERVFVSGGQDPEGSDLVLAARKQPGAPSPLGPWQERGRPPRPLRGHGAFVHPKPSATRREPAPVSGISAPGAKKSSTGGKFSAPGAT